MLRTTVFKAVEWLGGVYMLYPYTILVGNSPNLLANHQPQAVSWEAITRKLEETYREILDDKSLSLSEDALLSLRIESLQNILQGEKRKQERNFSVEQKDCVSRLENAWNIWYGDLLRLEPGSVHRLIAKWAIEKNAALITTNYDLTFEKALDMGDLPSFPLMGQKDISLALVRQEVAKNASRKRGRVWHMHGDAYCPASIVAGKSSYHEALDGLRAAEQREGSWLYQFLHSKVFICGLNFRQDEELLMRALHLRTELPKEERHPVFYFHFYRKGDEEGRRNAVIQLLKGLDVKLIEIPVYADQGKEDYQSAWYHLMGQIGEEASKEPTVAHLPSNPSEGSLRSPQSVSSISHDAPTPVSHGTPAPEPRHTFAPNVRRQRRSRRYESIVRTSTPTMMNPDRCWINIGVEKLRKNWGKDWIFECRIGGNLYVYHYPSRELEQIFVQNEVALIETGTPRYNLYIDYRRGELYSTVTPFNANPLVVLKKGASPSECSPLD